MRLGLGARILIAGGIVVLFLVVEFVLVLRPVPARAQPDPLGAAGRAGVVAASRVEKFVLDLETGTRGYLITRDRRFLAPSRVRQDVAPGGDPRVPGARAGAGLRRGRRQGPGLHPRLGRAGRGDRPVSGDAAVVDAATREGSAGSTSSAP